MAVIKYIGKYVNAQDAMICFDNTEIEIAIKNIKDGVEKLENAAKRLKDAECYYTKENFSIKSFEKIYVSGNTVMMHILCGVNPKTIGVYPFKPVFLESKIINIGNENVTLLDSISGFIGSDISSGIIATNLDENTDSILIDLGTNGEIVLNTNKILYATSTAVGPAFEGANIECGVGGIDGAINSCNYIDGKLIYRTINDKKPVGICGSGLIDVISILLEEDLLDEMGVFKESNSKLFKNIKNNKFYITDEIYVSQKDIGNFQLAKSAIVSGINILIKKANVKKLNKIFLAGGFGFYLNLNSARRVGLIPKNTDIEVCGNTSSNGTIMCLVDDKNISKIKKITKEINSFNLSESLEFDDEFINNMFF